MKDLKISNELLNYVFTDNLQSFKVDKIENNILYYFWLNEGFYGDESNCKWEKQNINIYEFVHLNLKQWAKLKNVFGKIDWSEEPEQIFKKAEELRNEIS